MGPPDQAAFTVTCNGGWEINEQVGQDEVTVGQKLLREKEEIEMSDTDSETPSEKEIIK